MAAWNVTICSSASSLLKMSSKNRVEQVLGMVPSPQLSPHTIRGGEKYLDQLAAGAGGGGGSPKRPYYAAFADQMGDEEVMVEEEVMGVGGEGVVLKKRRLSSEQVRYLESSFESENKLEPERKAQIAHRLGLQPRQVAVWFQNRRARSKSKQLERDFNALKAEYHAVLLENEKLQAKVDRLTAQLREGSAPPAEGGGQTAVAKEILKEVKTSASNVCSSNCGSVGVVKGEEEEEAEVEASTASGEMGRGNELADGEEQSSPCTILADVNVNVNVSASVMPIPRARVAETVNYEADDIHLLTNCMHQVYAHQLVDFYTADYDSSFLMPLDDPWSD